MVARERVKINKEIGKLLKPIYFREIPLADMFDIIEKNGYQVVDEEGNRWAGFICGREGTVIFDIVNLYTRKPAKYGLNLQWYKMDYSGNYEVTSYVG